MQTNPDQIIEKLETLLEKERSAILAGDLKSIGSIASEKEKLFIENKIAAPNLEALERLRKMVSRNQTLLAAAIKGVRAVTSKLGALQSGQCELSTYNKSGKRIVLGVGLAGTLQHKA